MASRLAYGAFRRLNRWTTVPLLRAGIGAWLGSPIGGWLLLLRVTGRRTGLAREVPLSYLIAEGSVWVMSGFGPRAQWYRNLLADPVAEVVLPGRVVRCQAEDVTDPETRRRIIPRLARAVGVPGYLGGFDPYRSTADRILAATAWVPLIRLRPEGAPLAAGPDDPGGLGWVWRQAVVLVAAVWLARLLAARFRRPT
jgi:deazaflavin-dependent oxidoreductase (nitroreductase family)